MGVGRTPLVPVALVFAALTIFATTALNAPSTHIDWDSIETPPYFTHEPNPLTLYFKTHETVVKSFSRRIEKGGTDENGLATERKLGGSLEQILRCKAQGNPRPEYRWKKNGKQFEYKMYPDRVTQIPGEGTLIFTRFQESDAGSYQCEARNSNGTAIDRPVRLEETWIRHFPPAEPEIVKVELGDSYERNCTPPVSNPKARVYWIFMGREQGQFETIASEHISSNDAGTLFFHFVNFTDLKESKFYTCTAENTELHDYKFGNQFSLEITTNKRRSLAQSNVPMPPAEQYVNQSSPVAMLGNTHKLHCFFSGYPTPQPKWYHNGMEISYENSDGFKFENFGKTLVFNVTQDKAGKYDCRYSSHQDIDRTFNVIVEAAPYWPEGPPPNTNTSEGEQVKFDCMTSGNPTPIVTFYKNGVELKAPKSADNYLIEGNSLTIYDVKKGQFGTGDNAVYQCKAENKHGYVWTNFYLNLLAYKPEILEAPEEVEIVEGQTAVLTCKFFASPNANITWESPVLKGVAHTQEPANAHGVGKLVIPKVTSAAQGDYECIGSNKYGDSIGHTRLVVREPTRLEAFPSTDLSMTAGKTVVLDCAAKADPSLELNYEWLIDGRKIPQEKIDEGHYTIAENHSLIIDNPAQYDTASYRCVAATKLDKVSKEIKLKINDVPVPPHSAYVSNCQPDQRTAEISYEHFESAYIDNPVKEFWVSYQLDPDTEGTNWITHPVPGTAASLDTIEGDQRVAKAKTTVSLVPFGNYRFRVVARNAIGDSAPTIVKGNCETPSALPDKNPEDVKASGTSPENLIVHWSPMERKDWNGEDFHYLVKYRPTDEQGKELGEWRELAVNDPFADKVTVQLDDDKEAKPFQPYDVMVYAVNKEGTAQIEPETVQGRSGEGVPSSAPLNFRALNPTGTTVDLAWDPVDPATANGNFTGYKITYWADSADEEEEEEVDEAATADERWRRAAPRALKLKRSKRETDGKKRTLHVGPLSSQTMLTDLKSDTLNYAYIQVTNGANDGPPSETISFKTLEGVPTPVRGLNAFPMNPKEDGEQGVVALVWKKPRRMNGKLQKYVVEQCEVENGKTLDETCKKIDVDPTQNEHRITGLQPDTDYRFILRGATGTGEGDPTSVNAKTLPATTAAGVDPGRPSFDEQAIGDNYFNISYRPASFDRQEQQPVGNTFAVEYREEGSDQWTEVPQDGDKLAVHVDQLHPGTTYEVRVAALQEDKDGQKRKTYSPVNHITTKGRSFRFARWWFWIILLLILLLLLLICCIIIVACRHHGDNYPVSQREREQGREPILGKQKFGEYKHDDDEKRSLTGSKAESETDSMAEYGDTDPGRFTEDGSFIGQYVPQKTLLPPERPEKGSTSTFV